MIGVDGALYQSMEFTGEGVQYLTMDDQAVPLPTWPSKPEAKNGIFPVDELTEAYMKEHQQPSVCKYMKQIRMLVYEQE